MAHRSPNEDVGPHAFSDARPEAVVVIRAWAEVHHDAPFRAVMTIPAVTGQETQLAAGSLDELCALLRARLGYLETGGDVE